MWLVSTYRDACLISTWASHNGEKTKHKPKQPSHGIWSPSQRAKEAGNSMFPASNIPSAPWPHSALSHPCLLQSEGFPALKVWRSPWFHVLSLLPPQCVFLSPTFHSGAPVAFYMYAHGAWLTSADELSLSFVPAWWALSSPLLRGGLKARDWVLSITATPEPCIIIIHTNRIHTQ